MNTKRAYTEFSKSDRSPDVERRRMETDERTQFHWLRGVTQPERVQQTRNIDEPGGSEQREGGMVAKSMKRNNLTFSARTALKRRPFSRHDYEICVEPLLNIKLVPSYTCSYHPLNPPTPLLNPSTTEYLHDPNLTRTKPISAFLLKSSLLAECSSVGLEVMW